MTRLAALAALLTLNAGAAAQEPPPKTPSPVDQRAAYSVPKDWNSLSLGSGADQNVQLSHLRYLIRIRLLGGKGSQYPTPADFLDGFEARSLGKPPKRGGTVTVSGIPVPLYQRKYPVDLGDPHSVSGNAPKLAKEEFLILPAGDRFFVLSYTFESALPDLRDMDKTAWGPFLKSFRLKK